MGPVQFAQQSQAALFDVGRAGGAGPQVQDRHPFGAERRTLIKRRHPAARPVANAVDGQAARIGQHDISGQVLILGAQAICRPRPDAGPAGNDHAGVHHPQGLFVIAVLGEHRANDGDFVGMTAHVRQRLGERQPRLALADEAKRALEQVAGDPFVVGNLGRRRPAIVAIEHRLGIEKVDMARPAMHE